MPHRLVRTVLLSFLFAPAALAQEGEPLKLEIGPETTVVDGPVNPDGTINYIAALNEMYGKGVKPGENAAIGLASVVPPSAWPKEADYRRRYFEAMGVQPPQDAGGLVEFDVFAQEAVPDQLQREAMYYEQALEGPWTADELPVVAQWLEAIEPSLARVEEALEKPEYYSPLVAREQTPVLISVLRPQLLQRRHTAHAIHARANQRLGRGDVTGAVEDALLAKRFSRVVQDEPLLLGKLVAVSIAAIGRDVLEDALATGELQPAQAKAFIHRLQNLPPMDEMDEAVDRDGRFVGLDAIQHLAAGNAEFSRLQYLLSFWSVDESRDADSAAYDALNRAIHEGLAARLAPTLRKANAFYDRTVAAMRADTYQQVARQAGLIERELEARDDRVQALFASLAKLPVAQQNEALAKASADVVLTTLVFSTSVGANEAEVSMNAYERLEPVAIALNAYRGQHDRYPRTLDALIPAYLDAVPTDPFTGEPIRYRLTDDAAVVYSVGPDMADDGGVPNEEDLWEGDLVFRLPARRS